jgi:large subunit ribosomal protein L6
MPEKVKAEFKEGILEVTGHCGKLSQVIDKNMNVKIDKSAILVEALGDSRRHNMLHGLTRGLIVNMVEGVTKGFKKELEIVGFGYKVNVESGKNLVMAVGFSHLVTLPIPCTVKVNALLTPDKNTLITVTGIDKYEVGAFAARIRAVKPAEPYKGFGIKYASEKIIRKAGKTAASAGRK